MDGWEVGLIVGVLDGRPFDEKGEKLENNTADGKKTAHCITHGERKAQRIKE